MAWKRKHSLARQEQNLGGIGLDEAQGMRCDGVRSNSRRGRLIDQYLEHFRVAVHREHLELDVV